MSGTMIAQAVPVLVSPILTRQFTPFEIGNLGLFTAVINVIGPIICGRYDVAILAPKQSRESVAIYATAIRVAVAATLILGIPYILLELFDFLNLTQSNILFLLLPISVFLFGYFSSNNYLSTKYQQYKTISSARVMQTVSASVIQIALGFLSFLKSGLLIGYVVGQFVSSFYLSYINKKRNYFSKLLPGTFTTVLKKYKDYILINAPASLMDSISIFAPTFFIKAGYGSEQLGYYTLAQRLITLPAVLIGQAVSQVFFQRISSFQDDKEKIRNELFRIVKNMSLIALLIGLCIFLLSPFLFATVFGTQWKFSGELASIMSLSFFIRFIVNPVSPVFIATQKLKQLAVWQTVYFILIIILSVAGIQFLTVKSLVTVYAFFDLFSYTIYFLMILKIVR